MGIWEIVVGILVLILSIVMVIVIILQEGHQAGLGTVTGGADSFLSRGKARTADAIFARVTKYCAITFFVLVVLLNALSFFGISGDKVDSDAQVSTSSETSAVVSTDESKEESSETSAETSTGASTESSAETSTETSTETSAEVSTEESAETSVEESTEAE